MTEKHWAAGFYEGEGSISFVAPNKLMLVMPQVDVEPLERFARAVGAGVLCWDARRGIHLLRVSGMEAQRVAMWLWPELSQRRQHQILQAVRGFVFRRVRDPQRCRRGHVYSVVGAYVPPGGGRECAACRDARRGGNLRAAPALPRAIDIGLGVRQYAPVAMS